MCLIKYPDTRAPSHSIYRAAKVSSFRSVILVPDVVFDFFNGTSQIKHSFKLIYYLRWQTDRIYTSLGPLSRQSKVLGKPSVSMRSTMSPSGCFPHLRPSKRLTVSQEKTPDTQEQRKTDPSRQDKSVSAAPRGRPGSRFHSSLSPHPPTLPQLSSWVDRRPHEPYTRSGVASRESSSVQSRIRSP